MILTKVQANAVEELVQAYKKNIEGETICFKAPTGSGKTFMASEFIYRIFQEEQNEKVVIVFLTISQAELPKQLADKLEEYKRFHREDYLDYDVEFIDSPSNTNDGKNENLKEFTIKNRKVFVFGVSSFGKNTLFYENETLTNFLKRIKQLNYKLVFIRDEAHIGKKAKENDTKQVAGKLYKAAYFSLEMSATPKEAERIIEITKDQLYEDGEKFLLKKKHAIVNIREKIGKDKISETEFISFALKEFIESKQEYEKLKLESPIRPALLIQVKISSKKDQEKKRMYENCMNLLKKELNKHNLTYLIYLEDEKKVMYRDNEIDLPATLKYASKPNSKIDVIIFKIGPSTGWDIPRANTLLQLRDVYSETLNLQTLGRIMRNPYPNLEYNSTTDKYYLYYLNHLPSENLVWYKLSKNFVGKKLLIGTIKQKNKKEMEIIKKYKKVVHEFINGKVFTAKLKMKMEEIEIYNEHLQVVMGSIENAISLKIKNEKMLKCHGKRLHLKSFEKDLRKLKIDRNLEIKKFWLYQCISQLNKYMKEARKTESKDDVYEINDSEEITESYVFPLLKKNKSTIPHVNEIIKINNYGYIQCSQEENKKQYLDSKPEEVFLSTFRNEIIKGGLKIKVDFIAKLPVSANIYFEYRSKQNNNDISKSHMDFVIEYKNQIIMIEVKSDNHDINWDKTEDLKRAYKEYMLASKKRNKKKKEIHLVLYTYNSDLHSHKFIYWNKNGKLITECVFIEAFKNLFGLNENKRKS